MTGEDTLLGPLSFTVGDRDTTNLLVSASSSKPALIPDANILLEGAGSKRDVSGEVAVGEKATTQSYYSGGGELYMFTAHVGLAVSHVVHPHRGAHRTVRCGEKSTSRRW